MTAPTDLAKLAPAERALLEAAREAAEAAVCPYSRFPVGAALEDDEGNVWTGANVENASFTLGLCAERVALFYAITHGAKAFRTVAVATHATTPTPPCGACRQILWEYCRDADVLMVAADGTVLRRSVRALMPDGFDAGHMG